MKEKREKERESPPIVRGGISQDVIGLEREVYYKNKKVLNTVNLITLLHSQLSLKKIREQVTHPPLWSILSRELPQLPPQLTTTIATTCESANIGERSHQTPSTPLIDLARPGCSKWMVIGQRRQTKSQESRATGSTAKFQQDGVIALQAHPELLNSIPPEHALFLFHVNKPERQLALINQHINQHMPPLVSKLDLTDTLLLYQIMNNYATPINQIAEMIKECLFVDVKEAILVFDHSLRSFIPSFTLFKVKTTVSKGLKRTIVTCHTSDHKKHSEEPSHHQKMQMESSCARSCAW